MTEKEIVKEFYETVITNNEIERIAEFIDEDSIVRIGNTVYPLGVAGMQEHLKATKKTYPDYSMQIIRQYQEGNTVMSEFIMTGTHEGEWIGITPTHQVLQFSGVDIDTVVNGKITEHGGAVNTFDTLWEAGLIQAK